MIAIPGVLAQVDVDPSTDGMPGADLIQQLLNWAQMLALWGSLAALLIGAAMYGLAREGGSYGGASRGKTLALGGVVGAILAGGVTSVAFTAILRVRSVLGSAGAGGGALRARAMLSKTSWVIAGKLVSNCANIAASFGPSTGSSNGGGIGEKCAAMRNS